MCLQRRPKQRGKLPLGGILAINTGFNTAERLPTSATILRRQVLSLETHLPSTFANTVSVEVVAKRQKTISALFQKRISVFVVITI